MKRICSVLSIGVIVLAAAAARAQAPQAVELNHIDVTLVDRSVNPCSNFYQYACGKLNAAQPIPADQISWGSGAILAMWNRQVLRGILEANEAARPGRTANEQKIGDLYASCMAQDSSRTNDLRAIQPLQQRILAMRTQRDMAGVLAEMQRSFGASWSGDDNQVNTPLFGFGPQSDFRDVNRIVGGVDQGGLGMPSRTFYLDSSEAMQATRNSYRTLLTQLFTLSGQPAPAAATAADTVLRMETAIAQAQMDNITRRDPNKTDNRFTLAQLKALMPNFAWDAYFEALGAPATPLYEVSAPQFFRALNTLLLKEDIAAWKTYLQAHLLLEAAPSLGVVWRDAEFEFQKQIFGQKVQAPAWRRCTRVVDAHLGEALGEVYIAQVFPAGNKTRVLEMVRAIEAAMARDIDNASWMQASTKAEARLKLAAIINKIGYPNTWRDYAALHIQRDSYPANIEAATAFEMARQLAKINRPLDKMEWGMTAATVNAYEDPTTNTINFPAGILAPPFFDAKQDDVINYGSEGAVIGHELTHDFDDQGRKFDHIGNLRDWWTASDAAAYEQRGQCIANEYSGSVPGAPGVVQNGKLTQGEDTADNGGIYLSLDALQHDLKTQGKSMNDKDANGVTNWQRFFLAYANSWCDSMRPEALRTLVLTNPHSAPELRVNNVVGNMPEFQQAFSCKVGQPEVHAPACRVW